MAATLAGSTGTIAFRSQVEPDLRSIGILLRLNEQGPRESVIQYFKSPKCLLALFAFLTIETSRASTARACDPAYQLADQEGGCDGEDRQQQDRKQDQPRADRDKPHQVFLDPVLPVRLCLKG